MGALNGSLSYLRFLVDGDLADNPGAAYEKSLQSRRFVPLLASQESADSAGWVATEAPFDDERKLTRDRFLFGDLIAVRGDPLTNITLLERIEVVVKGGDVVKGGGPVPTARARQP